MRTHSSNLNFFNSSTCILREEEPMDVFMNLTSDSSIRSILQKVFFFPVSFFEIFESENGVWSMAMAQLILKAWVLRP